MEYFIDCFGGNYWFNWYIALHLAALIVIAVCCAIIAARRND